MTTYKGLTLTEVIECFTDPLNNMDSQLLNIFLYTYRNYCSSLDVIKMVNKRLVYLNEKSRFHDSIPGENEGFTKAIISLINNWLTFPFVFDFCEVPDFESINYLLKKIRSWPKAIVFIRDSEAFRDSFKRLEDKISSALNIFNTTVESNGISYAELPVDCDFRESFLVNNVYRDDQYNCSLLYQSAEVIANSLTHLDQKVLQNLKLQELLTYIRKKPAPSVTAVINNYNQLYNVVILTVKEPSLARKRFDQYQYSGRNSPVPVYINIANSLPASHRICEQRFQVIEKWIQIIQILSNIRNYSSLMAIRTALDNPENISIMKKSSKLLNQYQSLVKINEPHINQNQEQMEMLIDSGSSQPTSTSKSKGKNKNIKPQLSEIPYLGTYLKTLTYIDDGFSDFLNPSSKVYNGSEEMLINLDKCRRQFDVLVQIKLCISAIKNNEIQPDEQFLKWYSAIQRECQKDIESLSDSSHSLESEKSDLSINSSVSYNSINSECQEKRLMKAKHPYCKSIQSLNIEIKDKRSHSASPRRPEIKVTPSVTVNEPKMIKVATVKLKEPKNNMGSLYSLYRSTNFPQNKKGDFHRKPDTISNATFNQRDRLPLSNIVRSSSSVNRNEKDLVNLENILYKKIQINEEDHTSNFIERVFDKFGMPELDPSNFEVMQILENGRQIVITDNTNIFYGLAEQSEYLIEIHPKK